MKKFKFSHLLLAIVGVLAFVSCKHEHADWTPGAQDATMGVYFPNTSGFVVSASDTSVDIAVARVNTDNAAEVMVNAADTESSDIFTFPSSVSFAAGESEATYTISFDGGALEIGKTYSILVQLSQKEASSYAISEAVFTVMIPEPWTSMGEGIYFDDFLCNLMQEADAFRGAGAYVEFEKSDLDENRIRVVNPFAPATIGAMWGAVPEWLGFMTTDTTYLEFDIADPANVKLAYQLEFSNGSMANVAPLNIQLSSGGTIYDLYLLVWSDSPIVLEEGIIKFPTTGEVELAAFYGGEYYGYFSQCNSSGFFQYYLPGVEFVNYDMVVSYDGMFVSADGATAKAIFNFALGADVASYKFAFVPGDVTADPSEAVAAIVEGSEDLVIFESDAETKRWEVELTKGVYTLVAVPYTEEGEARTDDALVYNFYFNGTGEMPEVNIDVEIGVPSELVAPEKAAEIEAQMPAPFYIGTKITADPSHLKAIKFWYGDSAAVEEYGLTLDQLFNEYGGDASAWIQRLEDGDGVMVGGFNVLNGSANTVYLRFETIYGTSIDYVSEEPYVTAAYDGDFYVGEYAFQDGEGENVSQMVFGVIPGNSYSNFFFTHPMIDGSMWYATYDAEAATLTVSGVEYGYEKYGNQYGGLYGAFNEDATLVYGYSSSTTADFADPTAPLVFNVADNVLAELTNYFAMRVVEFDPETNQPGAEVGKYFLFTPSTVIATSSAAEPLAQRMSVAPKSKKASMVCGEALYAGTAAKAERVVKATPIEGYDFTPATFVLQH